MPFTKIEVVALHLTDWIKGSWRKMRFLLHPTLPPHLRQRNQGVLLFFCFSSSPIGKVDLKIAQTRENEHAKREHNFHKIEKEPPNARDIEPYRNSINVHHTFLSAAHREVKIHHCEEKTHYTFCTELPLLHPILKSWHVIKSPECGYS